MKPLLLRSLSILALGASALAQAPNLSPVRFLPGDDAIVAAPGTQVAPRITAGGPGALAVWSDRRTAFHSNSVDEESGQDVFGVLLDPSGQPIGTSFAISAAGGYQRGPKVAWNGSNFLVAWEHQIGFHSVVRARLVAPDGTLGAVLEPIAFARPGLIEYELTANGPNFLVVARGSSSGETSVLGRRISPTGAFLDPTPVTLIPGGSQVIQIEALTSAGGEYLLITDSLGLSALRLASDLTAIATFTPPSSTIGSNGAGYLVGLPSMNGVLRCSRMTLDGTLLDVAGIPYGSSSQAAAPTTMTWDGEQWWIVWAYLGTNADGVVAARVTPSGTVLDFNGIPIDPANAEHMAEPHAAGSGLAGGVHVVWTDYRSGGFRPEDVRGAFIDASGSVGADRVVSVSRTFQTSPDLAPGDVGFVVAYRSEDSLQARILLQRVDAGGNAIDLVPIEVSNSGTSSIGAPAIAFDGVRYLVVWSENGAVLGRRYTPALVPIDASPFVVMAEGSSPDVAALGNVFLVAADDDTTSIQFRHVFCVRVDGPSGTVLDPAPTMLSTSFAFGAHVAAFGDRWIVAWQRHPSHDNPNGMPETAIVHADGTNDLPLFLGASGGQVDVAVSTAQAMVSFRRRPLPNADNDIGGVRVSQIGTLIDPLGGFDVSTAPKDQLWSTIAWNGAHFYFAWQDQRTGDFYDLRSQVRGALSIERTGSPGRGAGLAATDGRPSPERSRRAAPGRGR